jgi:hypothetical protein
MIDYDKDHIPDATIQKLKPLTEEEVMSEGRVKNASNALVAVRIWITAMIIYHETLKIVNLCVKLPESWVRSWPS